MLGVPQAAALGGSTTLPPPPNHAPPAAHAHHGHAGTPISTHPPAAHVPPPLPELGPSVALLTDDNPSSVNQGSSAPDYEAYYVKTEEQQHHHQQQQQQQQQSQNHQQQSHMTVGAQHLQPDPNDPTGQRMTVTPELLGLMPSANQQYSSGCNFSDADGLCGTPTGRKLWTDEDMDKALDALRNSQMSLSRAAQVFGIPATTLWQRAHRMGIETPKKEGANKTWSEHDLAGALEELRSGRLSANRASKEFGIPNSTLYKIARKEGIKLSSPFSAIQPSWNPEDLNKALDAIRGGMSVQKSAQEYGIPTGTLYGRCRREGIELSKYQGVPWSEEDMKDALEVVRVGEMSINQAAIHYNLPYSSLYGRFKRDSGNIDRHSDDVKKLVERTSENDTSSQHPSQTPVAVTVTPQPQMTPHSHTPQPQMTPHSHTPQPPTPQPTPQPQSTPLPQTPQPQPISVPPTPTPSVSVMPTIHSVTSEYSDPSSEAPASVYSGTETLYSPVDGHSNSAPLYSPPSSIAPATLPPVTLATALSSASLSHDALYPATAAALSQVTLPHPAGMQPHLPQVYPTYYPLEYSTLRPDYRTYQAYSRPLPDDSRSQYSSPYPPYHF
ncbi:DNA binding HTH domain Psq-type [Trinorchestia longiramus]|nr:DNA binding HTH domain Psq-type [Trinorchestia longiramus]